MALFTYSALKERFFSGYLNDELLVKGISYGRHFFPDPADYQQAIALAQYQNRSTGIQLGTPTVDAWWQRFSDRHTELGGPPIPQVDLDEGPYVDEVLDTYEAFRQLRIRFIRQFEALYFFGTPDENFAWQPDEYSRILPDPGADPTKKYPHARYPMDLRAALEYWQYRLYNEPRGFFPPAIDAWSVAKDFFVLQVYSWPGEGCDDARVRSAADMNTWAEELLALGINLLKTQAPGYIDSGETGGPGNTPRFQWTYTVGAGSVGSNFRGVGVTSYAGFLEVGHTQGYHNDIRMNLSRFIFSIVTDSPDPNIDPFPIQLPEQNRQMCLHIGLFTDEIENIGEFNLELVRLPDDTHLLNYPDEMYDAFLSASSIATFPFDEITNQVLKVPLSGSQFEATLTGRCNYGLRLEGDTVGWAGGGDVVVPPTLPLDGTTNPDCDWDAAVPCDERGWQAGVNGTCTVQAGTGVNWAVNTNQARRNTFVFVRVTRWYPELMGIDFWP